MEWLTQRLINQEGGTEWLAQIKTWLGAIDAPFPPLLRAAMASEAALAASRPGSTAAQKRAVVEAAAVTGEAALASGGY
jgi:predicted lipid carrier protein YhbT